MLEKIIAMIKYDCEIQIRKYYGIANNLKYEKDQHEKLKEACLIYSGGAE